MSYTGTVKRSGWACRRHDGTRRRV